MRHLPYLLRLQAARPTRALAAPVALAASFALASPALASTGGGSMPWDNIITTVQQDLSGPVATGIGVIAIIIFGLGMAMGHEGSALKRGMTILFGLAIVFSGVSALSLFGGGATGAVF